jgi:hypothetical protein
MEMYELCNVAICPGRREKWLFSCSIRMYVYTATKIQYYVFPEKELGGLSPNFHIHVSVSDLYIPRIGLHIFLQQNRQTDHGNI